MRRIATALALVSALATHESDAFSSPPSCPTTREVVHSTTALFQQQQQGSMSAAPSFAEYMEQRAAAAASEAPAVVTTKTDAFTEQLAAMEVAPASPAATITDDASSVSDNAIATPPRPSATATNSNSKHNIGRLLLQRSIQTQLYYLADLRDEPTYTWLRGFLGHDHLDDRGKFNELDGLHAEAGWRSYLPDLEDAPPFGITVRLAPPVLSAQQKRNPYLAAQILASGKSYEETIEPAGIARTLRAVARSLGREWAADLSELAAKDRVRVALHMDCHQGGDSHQAVVPPRIQTRKDADRSFYLERQVVAGGEGDDQGTPLYKLNARMVARFCTRAALRRVVEELQGTNDANDAAERDAGQWLLEFTNEWVPRLVLGADDNVRQSLGTPPPGQWQRLCQGADADDATEALWQELPQDFALFNDFGEECGERMRRYSSEALAARVRGARADICDEVSEELSAILAYEFA